MKKTISKILICFLLIIGNTLPVIGQCPTESINLNTQQSIDDFSINFPNCVELENNLTISGADITNLNGLSQIESFFGANLTIEDCPNLISLEGLNNLNIIINGNLSIQQNDNISNLSGLESLTNVIGSLYIGGNSSLNSFDGLNNLTSVSVELQIAGNPQLLTLSALSNLNSVYGTLFILVTPLNSLTGLENLTNIGRLNLSFNYNLTDIDALENLNSSNIDDIFIRGNEQLAQCSIESICNYLSFPINSATIENNFTGCNSRLEIMDACALNIENLQLSIIDIFPNPTNDKFNISGLKNEAIEIIDSQGKIVKKIPNPKSSYSISELAKGIYFIKVTSENSSVIKKLVKL